VVAVADEAQELADRFVGPDNSIKFVGLMGSLLGGFVAVVFSAGIQVVERFVLLQVWVVDGIGNGAADLVRTILGTGPATAVQAFTAAYAVSLQTGPLQPFLLVLNALAVVVIFGTAWEVMGGG
jgi:hypothetical protein